MYCAKVIQIAETGEEFCLREFRRETYDEAEDRACEWANDRDLDNQYPESTIDVRVEKEPDYYV